MHYSQELKSSLAPKFTFKSTSKYEDCEARFVHRKQFLKI